jgi:hypothetical protein
MNIAIDLQIKEFVQGCNSEATIGQDPYPVEPVNVDDSVEADDTEYKIVTSTIDEIIDLNDTRHIGTGENKTGSSKQLYSCHYSEARSASTHTIQT